MLLNDLASLRFVDAHAHVAIVGPVGVGKTFLAHALAHIACRRGYSVHAARSDAMLNTLRHARLDNSYRLSCASSSRAATPTKSSPSAGDSHAVAQVRPLGSMPL